jgi:hypothetical protein
MVSTPAFTSLSRRVCREPVWPQSGSKKGRGPSLGAASRNRAKETRLDARARRLKTRRREVSNVLARLGSCSRGTARRSGRRAMHEKQLTDYMARKVESRDPLTRSKASKARARHRAHSKSTPQTLYIEKRLASRVTCGAASGLKQ